MLFNEFEFTVFIRVIRHFVLHNLCDLNTTSWVALVTQLVKSWCLESRRLWVQILPELPFLYGN